MERLRKVYPDVKLDVFLYDDANSPLPFVPEGVTYEQTTFERCGNLNNYKCVAGMLERYKRASDAGYDWVIKCDCDTIINNLEWVLSNDREVVALIGKNRGHIQGPCYCLSTKAIDEMSKDITERFVKIYVQLCYLEDKTFTRLVKKYATGKMLGDYELGYCHESLENIEPWLQYYAVDFKPCLWLTSSNTWQSNRESAEERMKKYVEQQKTL